MRYIVDQNVEFDSDGYYAVYDSQLDGIRALFANEQEAKNYADRLNFSDRPKEERFS